MPSAARNFWLVKTEPDVFSIDDFEKAPGRTTAWDGVRNFEARNILRDRMKRGDRAFVYHSNAKPSAIVAVAQVVREGYPDETAFDPRDDHYDPASSRADPKWFVVDLKLVKRLKRPVSLEDVRGNRALAKMALLTRARLSVQPVTAKEWDLVLAMSE